MPAKGSLEYDIDALRANLIRCDDNIKTFEDAIQKEMETKTQLRRMIRALEEKQDRERQN